MTYNPAPTEMKLKILITLSASSSSSNRTSLLKRKKKRNKTARQSIDRCCSNMLLCPVFARALVRALKSPITDQTSAISRPALIAVGRDGRASTTWSHLAEPHVQIQANIKHRALLSKGTICSAEVDNSSRVA